MMKIGLIPIVVLVVVTAATAMSPFESADAATPQTQIDKVVFGRLERLGIIPANPCSDAVFVRRVYLDVIGTLPTAREARAFIANPDPSKRGILIDRLLEREEFADYWAMKWSDVLRIKSEFPINLWPNAVQAYHRWIRTSIRENRPYDRLVRDMLTASGSNFRVPQVNFYRAVQSKAPHALAQSVALTFMGVRPAETQDPASLASKGSWSAMEVFFSRVGFKSTSEWKEEIVLFDPNKPATREAVFPDGTSVHLSEDRDPR
jgi:hypothetical protein